MPTEKNDITPNKRKIRKFAKSLKLFDDLFFRKAAEDHDFCEEILRICLEDPKLDVLEFNRQEDITNLQGRSVVLDLLCRLGTGLLVNVEVQKHYGEKHFLRMRYNASCITANTTDPGDNFEKVTPLIIIYLTPFDLFKKGRVKYVYSSMLHEFNEIIDDKLIYICINAAVNDGSKIAKLMSVFSGDKKFRSLFPKTSAIIKRYQETEEGLSIMDNLIVEYFRDDLEFFSKKKIDELEKKHEEELKKCKDEYEEEIRKYKEELKKYKEKYEE